MKHKMHVTQLSIAKLEKATLSFKKGKWFPAESKKNAYNSTVFYKTGEVWAKSSIMLNIEVNHEIGRPVELGDY